MMGLTGMLSSGHGIPGITKINFANQHLNQPIFKNQVSKQKSKQSTHGTDNLNKRKRSNSRQGADQRERGLQQPGISKNVNLQKMQSNI
jgi:hypothetical protein